MSDFLNYSVQILQMNLSSVTLCGAHNNIYVLICGVSYEKRFSCVLNQDNILHVLGYKYVRVHAEGINTSFLNIFLLPNE
jgi:hypothetical protein